MKFLIAGLPVVYALYRYLRVRFNEWRSPLRDLPGPPSDSLIFGNFKQLWDSNGPAIWEEWLARYGRVFRYSGLFGAKRLYTTDLRAISHILSTIDVYKKPPEGRYFLSEALGNGLVVVEDETHSRQRKILNPAFGSAPIRELNGIFVDKSLQLRDILSAEVSKSLDAGQSPKIDVLSWLSKMTLDVIGLAGFHYAFNSLNSEGKHSELSQALDTILRPQTTVDYFAVLKGYFPLLRPIPTPRSSAIKHAKNTMMRIGRELLRESKASALVDDEKHGLSSMKGSSRPKDLLSLLVRANSATDLPDRQRLSDDEVLAQIPTFLVAGHETTSTGTAWALFALASDKRVQDKLRAELLSSATDTPSPDELNSLTYLDYVVRETLRFHAPVPISLRQAEKDDVLPLGTPCVDRKGRTLNQLNISKGDFLMVPILVLNRLTELWGDDASEFKPERWEAVPKSATSIPGVWGNMLTFFGGPRGCIGYRLSVAEMKAILYTLVRAFEFDLAIPAEDIGRAVTIVQRPYVKSNRKAGNQLPLLLRPLLPATTG